MPARGALDLRAQARLAQRLTELVREADDRRRLAVGRVLLECAVVRADLEQRPPHCVRITSRSDALRSLPALDRALGTGALTLDQVAPHPSRDARDGRRIGPHRRWQGAQQDRAGRAHDRPAHG